MNIIKPIGRLLSCLFVFTKRSLDENDEAMENVLEQETDKFVEDILKSVGTDPTLADKIGDVIGLGAKKAGIAIKSTFNKLKAQKSEESNSKYSYDSLDCAGASMPLTFESGSL
jgi:hypothetical protein